MAVVYIYVIVYDMYCNTSIDSLERSKKLDEYPTRNE